MDISSDLNLIDQALFFLTICGMGGVSFVFHKKVLVAYFTSMKFKINSWNITQRNFFS